MMKMKILIFHVSPNLQALEWKYEKSKLYQQVQKAGLQQEEMAINSTLALGHDTFNDLYFPSQHNSIAQFGSYSTKTIFRNVIFVLRTEICKNFFAY